MFDPPIVTTGIIVDSPQPKVYHVSLPNGKIVFGHVPKALIHLHKSLKKDSKVTLELTPFDFEKARICAIVDPLTNSDTDENTSIS